MTNSRIEGLLEKWVEPFACAAWMKLLAEEGFSAVMRRIDKGYPYPHVLFVCRKTERG